MEDDLAALLARARAGDGEARAAAVAANLGLVRHLARRFPCPGLEEDLFQVGCLGLVKAVDRFDPWSGNRFSTYGVPVILGEIRAFLRGDGPVGLGRAARGLARRARRAEGELRVCLGRDPTLREVAAAVGADAADLAAVLEAAAAPVSLQGPAGGGDAQPLEESLRSGDLWEEGLALRHALARLPDAERRVLALRYFLDRTQQEVADQLGVSQSHVSRLERRALARLRQQLA